jgi:hypothetical protein
MSYLVLFCITFANVAVRAFQQINVTHGHYRRIPATSYLFATFDWMLITGVVGVSMSGGNMWIAIGAMGTGGWIGCFFSMWLSGKLK